MKYCAKCGKELYDEAVVCPNCGCPTADYGARTNPGHSAEYPKLKEYVDKVNSAYVLGIISIILCMGIGLIFEIINLIKLSGLNNFSINLTIPSEIAEYQAAQRKLKTARTLTAVAMTITFVLIFILIVTAQM